VKVVRQKRKANKQVKKRKKSFAYAWGGGDWGPSLKEEEASCAGGDGGAAEFEETARGAKREKEKENCINWGEPNLLGRV